VVALGQFGRQTLCGFSVCTLKLSRRRRRPSRDCRLLSACIAARERERARASPAPDSAAKNQVCVSFSFLSFSCLNIAGQSSVRPPARPLARPPEPATWHLAPQSDRLHSIPFRVRFQSVALKACRRSLRFGLSERAECERDRKRERRRQGVLEPARWANGGAAR